MQREFSGVSGGDVASDNPERYPEAYKNAAELAALAAPDSGVVISGAQARRMLDGLPASYPNTVVLDEGSVFNDAISTVTYPVVLKSESGLLHREASGGVLRGIRDVKSAEHGVRYLNSRFGGVVEIIEEIPHGTEYIVGYKREPGYTLGLVGRGGTGVADAHLLMTPINRGQLIHICRQVVEPGNNPEWLADLILQLRWLVKRLRGLMLSTLTQWSSAVTGSTCWTSRSTLATPRLADVYEYLEHRSASRR